jgi:hypothetical protein
MKLHNTHVAFSIKLAASVASGWAETCPFVGRMKRFPPYVNGEKPLKCDG